MTAYFRHQQGSPRVALPHLDFQPPHPPHSFMMKKKVLLMGASGSGKTSMRSLIFSNNPASLTARLGATIDVEQNHVRFMGDLHLNLWDCGGQDSYMDTYLSTQRSTIFQQVGVMIYVFDIESRENHKDMEYFQDCLAGLQQYSPDAAIFLLIHKMDLVRGRSQVFDKRKIELEEASEGANVSVFGTSIYDESLYKAWSNIVNTLIPNAAILSKHLSTFAEACNAAEVILFERTTFLVIATSSSNPSNTRSSPEPHRTPRTDGLDSKRYERTSELVKAFKYSCTRVREEFRSLEMEMYDFTAVLDELTKNTYVMIIVHDPTIQAAALKMNIRLARRKFEELQNDSLIS